MEYQRTPVAVLDGLAQVAKGLAHPARLELLELLAQGERGVEGLAEGCGLRTSTASAHLQVLARAGLVARRRDGVRIIYRLSGNEVAGLVTALRIVAEREIAAVELARRGLERDDVPVVDLAGDELLHRARAGELVVIDVRSAEEFAAGHIPGARSIPVAELAARIDELDGAREIVAYCRGRYCVTSHDAVQLLRARGMEASVLSEGMLEWRAAERELELARWPPR